jgi:hypothetical protein
MDIKVPSQYMVPNFWVWFRWGPVFSKANPKQAKWCLEGGEGAGGGCKSQFVDRIGPKWQATYFRNICQQQQNKSTKQVIHNSKRQNEQKRGHYKGFGCCYTCMLIAQVERGDQVMNSWHNQCITLRVVNWTSPHDSTSWGCMWLDGHWFFIGFYYLLC